MSLEQAIQANTDAIIALTEALLKSGISFGETKTFKSEAMVNLQNIPKEPKQKKSAKEIATEDRPEAGAVAYKTVRELILKLAKDHAADIKALYKTVGVTKPNELLTDPDDFDSPILDQGKLNAIHEGLLTLEN